MWYESLFKLDTILKALISVGTSVAFMYGLVVKPIRQMLNKIERLTDDVAYLQGDRLNDAYDFYVKRGWCPGSKKRELERWYKAYKASGRDHLADKYLETLMALPEEPKPKRRKKNGTESA